MEEKRIYNGTDAFMIETATTIQLKFEADLPTFTAFDSSLDAAFNTEFKTTINQCLAIGTDETEVDNQTILTAKVLGTMANCMLKFKKIKYFAEKAFPGNVPVLNKFGADDFDTVRKSQPEMTEFMTKLHLVATEYKVQLIAIGANQAQIDEILVLRDELQADNGQQEVFIKDRPVLTQERIILLNKLYGFITTVNKAAQIVFYNNEAKKNSYVYMASSSAGTTVKEGIAGPNSTNLVAEVPYRANRSFMFENTGEVQIFFGLSNEATSIQGTVVGVPPGESASMRSEELFVGGTFVVCKNDGLNQSSYKVEYDN